MKNFLLVVISGVLLISQGCREDSGPPSADVIIPSQGDLFKSGDFIQFHSEFIDDLQLDFYNVTIEFIDTVRGMEYILAPFEHDRNYTLMGRKELINTFLHIPVDVATGNYRLSTYAKDLAGNASGVQTVEIHIKNSTDEIRPVLTINSLDDHDNEFLPDENILVEGKVTDNKKLGALEIVLFNDSNQNVIYAMAYALQGNSYDFEYSFQAPSEPGNYTLRIVLRDEVNNVVVREFRVGVSVG